MKEPVRLLDHGYIKLVGTWGDDNSPLISARMSTQNPTGVDKKKDDGLRDYLWRHSHATPFEFSELILEVQCPIFVAREWFRHRVFSFNELSLRYSEAPNLYYVPAADRLKFQDKSNKQASGEAMQEKDTKRILSQIEDEQVEHRISYDQYLEAGLARELARINVPVSLYTKFMVKGNLRNWLHFINLRSKPEAQYEIRVYSDAILDIIEQLWPQVAETFRENTFEAKTFSKSELKVLKGWIDAYLGEYSGRGAEQIEEQFLSGSKLKEFRAKLGI